MTLVEFLLARIAEDEETIGPPPHRADWEPIYPGSRNRLEFTHDGLIVEPSRAWAECEVKRRIIEDHAEVDGHCDGCGCFDRDYGWVTDPWPCRTLRTLTGIYADHPDCSAEWR